MQIADREKHIIEKLKRGDKDGLDALIDVYHASLCVNALKYVDDFDTAEDIVQEVFINFWEKKRYEIIQTSLKAYLTTAVRNKSLKHVEKAGRIVFTQLEEEAEDLLMEDLSADAIDEQKQLLLKELAKLPEKRREVLEHIVFRGMKYKEVAEELDVSINTVKTHFSRALKQLRDSLDIILLLMP
ncbi:MAG: RNA polymerase sigma-70 factor [Carboxylicivirga sp.]|jgi:RNA polymerase sigma-70 factor (ECF subfamily)|nr:RNA polymerase sigma-70 factor [Carboxylicivirga sp.]